ncbi:hypothetical protein TUMSATVNIG1_61270 (plasmid) [Vibrio nigripulchritudo]|uniref:hypothetical protein n=1 Tax=Vibrio nigripulchritudo TaxID=28173 RepID=UPI0019094ED2|nr:hypothetical protein [Vibrio nigripulchritudo]BCL74143.1 hypothetical protein VNTUMSATTG_60800 [Vibrio nigripulchritudo]BDU35518.1 hypothetical protein TUMSATVNIG1_61270 [Vibrio nigripulchritudo]
MDKKSSTQSKPDFQVHCFKYDSWERIDVFSLENGDVFVERGKSYVCTGKPKMENNKPVVPAKLYDTGGIVINLSKEREFITFAMDCVGSPAHEFSDGTMQLCDFSGQSTFVYSPRLPIHELNTFCREHKETYEEFYNRHEAKLYNGIQVGMDKFW